MFLNDPVFVGIDPTSGRGSFTYAALDRDLNLVELSEGEFDDLESFILGQKSAVVAVNAPAGINSGLVRKKMEKEALSPHQIRGADMRLAEFELREHGIVVYGTPGNVAICPAWVQMGFTLYRKLESMGFYKYPRTDKPFQVMETQPHACFCALAEKVPLSKPSLEGRLQRHLILFEQGLRIRDPMEFFEEITRYKLARGIWPLELLYLPEQLDAMVAALTAWLATYHTEKVIMAGDEREGNIVFPGSELKERY
jgi:hypothetical protein